MRLVDADALMEKEYSRLREGEVLHRIPPSHVDAAPTIDAVPVVRCRECRYYPTAKVNEKGFLICPASGMEITETDYCSYGERMDKEDEHEAG